MIKGALRVRIATPGNVAMNLSATASVQSAVENGPTLGNNPQPKRKQQQVALRARM
jgi:hypothetical protein